MRWLAAFLLVLLLPLSVAAQEDDKGLIVSFLEENLSSAGRAIVIDGFEGALSSRATLERLTIADDLGIWLVLEDAVLDWNRRALLSGRVEIRELSAGRLQVLRQPATQDNSGLPTAEAGGFRIPELPVSVAIDRIAIDRAELGPDLLGQAAVLTLAGKLTLTDAAAHADVALTRLDGPDADIAISAGFEDSTGVLTIDIGAKEAANGLMGKLLGLPGPPSLDFSLSGSGQLDDFTADIALATDEAERLAGQVTLRGASEGGHRFAAELGGDLTPLVQPAYRDFLGPDISLSAEGTRAADGAFSLETLEVTGRSLILSGDARFNAGGAPDKLVFDLSIADPTGAPVTLPVPGGATRLERAEITLKYNTADGARWGLDGTITDFRRPGTIVSTLSLAGAGTLRQSGGVVSAFDGVLDYGAGGLNLSDPALQAALGDTLGGRATFEWAPDMPFSLTRVALAGDDYRIVTTGTIGFDEGNPHFDGTVTLSAEDLSRYSLLAGQPLTGIAQIELIGRAEPLAGRYDLDISLAGDGLGIDDTTADELLEGPIRLSSGIRRDETGTYVDGLSLSSRAISAEATGQIGRGKGNLTLSAKLVDLGLVVSGQTGPVTLDGTAKERADGLWDIDFEGIGPHSSSFKAEGNLGNAASEVSLSLAVPDLAPVVPAISGPATIAAKLLQADDGTWLVDSTASLPHAARATVRGLLKPGGIRLGVRAALPDVTPYVSGLSGAAALRANIDQAEKGTWNIQAAADLPHGADATVKGVVGAGKSMLDLNAQIPNIGAYAPRLSGLVKARGRITERAADWLLDMSTEGPGAAQARIAGTVASDGSSVSLAASGTAPLGLANRLIAPQIATGTAGFDLAIDGTPSLAAVSGTISTGGARLSLPTLGQVLNSIDANVTLSGGVAQIEADGRLADGGAIRVDGPVALSDGQSANLQVALNNLALIDPNLYRTTLNGALLVSGPLAGGAAITGRLALGATEIRIPDSGFGFGGAIPEITHVNEPASVFATRMRAGAVSLSAAGRGSGGGAPMALDITIDAPQRIFVRGRGLDAELGGQVRLTGTTADMVPIGGFTLIRGRMDVLSKRLVLSRGEIRLEGSAVPMLDMAATAASNQITVVVEITGPADNPAITFTSQPELPQDEVLAQLFFGKDVRNISPLQAAQMAAAVRTLQGKGGGGVLERLRENFGLDDLDVSTDDAGETQLRVGKYLSDNIYTDVTTGAGGTTEINLNIDLRDNVTVKGSTSTTGESSIGIFFERDY